MKFPNYEEEDKRSLENRRTFWGSYNYYKDRPLQAILIAAIIVGITFIFVASILSNPPRAGKHMDRCFQEAKEQGYEKPKYIPAGRFQTKECLVYQDGRIFDLWEVE